MTSAPRTTDVRLLEPVAHGRRPSLEAMPRWEPNARERLVVAALELFEAQGYDETGVAQIADRAGLTKTTFFRHFSDKREVLAAGQEAHRTLLSERIVGAPQDASPLEAVRAALDALAATFPPETHPFVARVQAVTDEHSDLRERAALKRLGYVDAIRTALEERGVPAATRAVAAELGVLAFYTAQAEWVRQEPAGDLRELVRDQLETLQLAGMDLR